MNYKFVLFCLIVLLVFSFFINNSSITGDVVLAPLRVVGLVNPQCSECSDLSGHFNLFKLFNIPYVEEVVDVNSPAGINLISVYDILQVPAVIIHDLSFYPQLREFYLSYGSEEADGAYVFRSNDLIRGFIYERVTPNGSFKLVDYSVVNKSLGVSRGAVNSSVDIVMFGDFYCNDSRASLLVIDELLKLYDDVSFTFIPLPLTQEAGVAAVALECAGMQGRYWDFFTELFNKCDSALSVMEAAYNADLFMDGFISCLASDEWSGIISGYIVLAESLDVEGTPTFFINGLKIPMAFSISYFNDLYEKLKN